jgi:hypothetical protein
MAAPATPANLTIDAVGSNAIQISWDNVSGETGFYVYRSLNGSDYDKVAEVDADVLVFWDGPLEPSTDYYYKVSAYNGDGESALSSAVSDTTLAKSMKHHWVGTVGPHLYDENAIYKDEEVAVVGLRSEGKMRAEGAPSDDEDIIRKTDIEDYLAPGGTENNLVDFDSEGYPVDDSGLAVSDVSDAVSKKHSQNGDTDLNATFKATLLDCDNHTSGSANFVLVRQAAEADLNQTISDPPTQAEVQAISDKIDALLAKFRSANVLAP